jgi:hypothetical protein
MPQHEVTEVEEVVETITDETTTTAISIDAEWDTIKSDVLGADPDSITANAFKSMWERI